MYKHSIPAARDAPTAPPSLSARLSSNAKFSPFFMPRPPDTTTLAEARSGLSEELTASDSKVDKPASAPSLDTSEEEAEPPVVPTLSKAVVRVVISCGKWNGKIIGAREGNTAEVKCTTPGKQPDMLRQKMRKQLAARLP